MTKTSSHRQTLSPSDLVEVVKSELRAHRNLLFASFVFFLGAGFAFLAVSSLKSSSAAPAPFEAGNIISDSVMANYNSMTKDEIQSFLAAKNPCNNNNYKLYLDQSTRYPKISWHWAGDANSGHFVCISEEKFGDGVEIGAGQTAAEIIYAAAQEYKINPQVLLVLLEKEQGLITDTYPHSNQYRSATGYGCPDTAACDSRYFGFKNQIFRAAELFRYTLDNGSILYPEKTKGVYVAYSPSSACGGTEVYIENRATAALYRYTPYQPNAAALAAGNGMGDVCSAYGNRNFYNYFTKWFGNPKAGPFSAMSVSRILKVPAGTQPLSVVADAEPAALSEQYLYFTHRADFAGQLCLADAAMAERSECILYKDLIDYPSVVPAAMSAPRYLSVTTSSRYLDLSRTGEKTSSYSELKFFSRRVDLGDRLCLLEDEGNLCYFYDTLSEVSVTTETSAMDIPRTLFLVDGARGVQIKNGNPVELKDKELVFSKKIYLNGQLCLGTASSLNLSETSTDQTPAASQSSAAAEWCVLYPELEEYSSAAVSKMTVARSLYVPSDLLYRHAVTGIPGTTDSPSSIYFSGRSTIAGQLCLIPDEDYKAGNYACYPYYEGLREVNTFSRMDRARDLDIRAGSQYVSAHWLPLEEAAPSGRHHFTQKTYINGDLCLADDAEAIAGKCILYKNLSEL